MEVVGSGINLKCSSTEQGINTCGSSQEKKKHPEEGGKLLFFIYTLGAEL